MRGYEPEDSTRTHGFSDFTWNAASNHAQMKRFSVHINLGMSPIVNLAWFWKHGDDLHNLQSPSSFWAFPPHPLAKGCPNLLTYRYLQVFSKPERVGPKSKSRTWACWVPCETCEVHSLCGSSDWVLYMVFFPFRNRNYDPPR